MKLFKHPNDMRQLNRSDLAYPVVWEQLRLVISAGTWVGHPYDPSVTGFVLLVEPGDTDRVLSEVGLPWTLLQVPWEGVFKGHDMFCAVYLPNNEYGLTFVIPDEAWLGQTLRDVLVAHLD